MKNFRTLSALILSILLITNCSKSEISNNNNEINIEMGKKFIQFDTDIQTRAGIVEGSSLGDAFAVIGYQYRASWETEKIVATPNVFFNDEAREKLALPEIVTYEASSSLYSYEPIQAWTGNTYSFFAYYPSADLSIKLFDEGTVKQGEPYITYTLPNTTDPTDLLDVMTASYIDTDVNVSTSVGLNMIHRLTAIDVSVRNRCEDSDGNPADVTITDLSVKFTNLQPSKKIYLDPSHKYEESDESETTVTREFEMVGSAATSGFNTIEVPYDNTKMILEDTGNSEDNKALAILLIPQSDYLKGELSLSYQIGDNTETQQTYEFTFNRILGERRRFKIDVIFSADAISINLDPYVDWDSKNINHDFE